VGENLRYLNLDDADVTDLGFPASFCSTKTFCICLKCEPIFWSQLPSVRKALQAHQQKATRLQDPLGDHLESCTHTRECVHLAVHYLLTERHCVPAGHRRRQIGYRTRADCAIWPKPTHVATNLYGEKRTVTGHIDKYPHTVLKSSYSIIAALQITNTAGVSRMLRQ
jgi:hypothetical protein